MGGTELFLQVLLLIRSALRGFLVMTLNADRGINDGWPVGENGGN